MTNQEDMVCPPIYLEVSGRIRVRQNSDKCGGKEKYSTLNFVELNTTRVGIDTMLISIGPSRTSTCVQLITPF